MTTRKMPDKEQVLEAAKKCPEAREALSILFPDDFKENFQIRPGLICCSGSMPYLIAQQSDFPPGKEDFIAIGLNSGWATSPHSAKWVIEAFGDRVLAPGTQIILAIGDSGLVVSAKIVKEKE